MREYLEQTERYILPMALEVNKNMAIELKDLIIKKRNQMNLLNFPGLLEL
jgi:hypothetical protein